MLFVLEREQQEISRPQLRTYEIWMPSCVGWIWFAGYCGAESEMRTLMVSLGINLQRSGENLDGQAPTPQATPFAKRFTKPKKTSKALVTSPWRAVGASPLIL